MASNTLKADTWQAIAYGDYALNEALSLDAQVGLGRASLEGKRHIGFANKTAKADYHATVVQAGTGLNYRLGSEQSHLTPFARVDYTHVKSSGYTETGADALNLKVKGQSYDSLVWRVGVRGEEQVGDSLALFGTASVGLESLEHDNPITAEFTGAPGLAFKTRSTDYGRVVGNVAVGAVYRPAKNVELIGRYGVNLRKGYTGQNASATIQVRW
ncbi:MAG: autotransporter outer membrane beta-barrel domain-containing protein [Alcaligenaceae bacterium]|nr:autotransporter outer membrane beta-barrel domain-containing protein [Alcaligenaceae bacterium]